MSSQSTLRAPVTLKVPRTAPVVSVANTYGGFPESLWVQRMPGKRRLTATPELSVTRASPNTAV